MEHIFTAFKSIAEGINIIGVSILLFGFAKEFLSFFVTIIRRGIILPFIQYIQKIRCQLGIYILLTLYFLIASDIILSIIDLSIEELIKLSVTIVLRIAMGYFLGKEIDELLIEK